MGPVVLITGCTEGGIGHALCRYLHSRGCRVFATARRPEAATGLDDLGIPLIQLDVIQANSCMDAVEEVIAAAGRLDILINNAGVVTLGPSCEVPMDLVHTAFETNVYGLLQMCQAAHRQMVAQGGGKIINIGSLTGLQPVPLRGVYSATKAAVQRLSDALRIELAPFKVQVMLVAPGFIESNARYNARSSNSAPPTGGLWGGWLAALDKVTGPRLAKAVPTDEYAAALGSAILRRQLPRYWVGPCNGIEWLPRFMPKWLQDRVLSKALGIKLLEPEMKLNAAVLAARWQQQQRPQQQSGQREVKKER